MRILAYTLLVLAISAPAWATPITYSVTIGTLATGSLTVDTSLAPVLVNRGGLSNLVYQPSSWDFTALSSSIGNTTFSHTLGGHTGQWCVGICTFASPQQVRFDATDGGFFSLQFSFALNADGTLGGFSGGRYEWNDHNGAFRLRVLDSGSITSTSVPEPSTLFTLAVGLGLMAVAFGRTDLRRIYGT